MISNQISNISTLICQNSHSRPRPFVYNYTILMQCQVSCLTWRNGTIFKFLTLDDYG
jgi:hypothetical protein